MPVLLSQANIDRLLLQTYILQVAKLRFFIARPVREVKLSVFMVPR